MKKKVKPGEPKLKEVDRLKHSLARALADYDNLRKRTEKEKERFEYIAGLKTISKLLPVHDMLEEVQSHVKDSGLAIALESLSKVFSEEGVKIIDAKTGDVFDEDKHEVVEVVSKKGFKKNEIIEVKLVGWEIVDGPVIRHAKVIVRK